LEALADAAVANPGGYEDSEEEFEFMSQIRPLSIASIITRLRAAEADAARYRWLREQCGMSGSLTIAEVGSWELIPWSGDDIDAAIDAAMERKA